MDATTPQVGEDPKLRIMRVIATYTACIYSVLIYDWLTSLRREWKLVWNAPFSIVSVIYCVLRYWAICKYAISLYLSNTIMSHEVCQKWSYFQVYSILPIFIGVGTLLSLRIWALYERNKFVLASLLGLISISVVIICIAGREFGAPTFWNNADGPCFAGPKKDASKMTMTLWLLPFIVDLVCTILLALRVFIIRKRGASQGGLLSVLMRDGLAYFGVISSAHAINVIFYAAAPDNIKSVNSAMSYMLSSVACCRLILSLRAHAVKDGISHTHSASMEGGRTGGGVGLKSFSAHKTGGATRVRDPESLNVGSAWHADDEKMSSGNSHQMVPVHTLGINIGIERSVKISDEGSDKDMDEKEMDRMGRNGNSHF